ncbi:hypothetical protein P4V39_00945 [Brevibacillus borstelensis]|jgi:hypothetical protein|uniref:hypothetical protein n=1 Tax=Brevibacillus borstelensis TaxID=45462 RepID=UPI002E23943D|nr:hypothetical protein [Brevibacillus borstelensis]
MYLLAGVKESEDKILVLETYNLSVEENKNLTVASVENGVIVTELPTRPKRQAGTDHVLYVNPITKEAWYDQVSVPLTPEERIEQFENQLKVTQEALDALLLG